MPLGEDGILGQLPKKDDTHPNERMGKSKWLCVFLDGSTELLSNLVQRNADA